MKRSIAGVCVLAVLLGAGAQALAQGRGQDKGPGRGQGQPQPPQVKENVPEAAQAPAGRPADKGKPAQQAKDAAGEAKAKAEAAQGRKPQRVLAQNGVLIQGIRRVCPITTVWCRIRF